MIKWLKPQKCFHCFGRIWKLTVFTVLEESGSLLFSLFCKNLEAYCFHCFGRIWMLTVFATFWVICRGLCQKIVKTVRFQILPKQSSENSESSSVDSIISSHVLPRLTLLYDTLSSTPYIAHSEPYKRTTKWTYPYKVNINPQPQTRNAVPWIPNPET